MIWWIIIPAVIAAALAYAYWEHGKQGRRLTRLFAPVAKAHDGNVKAATFLALPQLRFERDGHKYFIGAMAMYLTLGFLPWQATVTGLAVFVGLLVLLVLAGSRLRSDEHDHWKISP